MTEPQRMSVPRRARRRTKTESRNREFDSVPTSGCSSADGGSMQSRTGSVRMAQQTASGFPRARPATRERREL